MKTLFTAIVLLICFSGKAQNLYLSNSVLESTLTYDSLITYDTIRVMLAVNIGIWVKGADGESYEQMGVQYAYEVRKVTTEKVAVYHDPNSNLPGGGRTLMLGLTTYEP